MLSEAEKEAQIDEMWAEHVHGGWWALYTYYHRLYRGVSWPQEALDEVMAAKLAAEAAPQAKKAEAEAPALSRIMMLLDR